MKENTIIIEMTPFLFEDGKTYYFDIKKQWFSYQNNMNLIVFWLYLVLVSSQGKIEIGVNKRSLSLFENGFKSP